MENNIVNTVAVLWDIENVTPASSDNMLIQGMWDYAESLGRVVTSTAYADWSKPGFRRLGPALSSLHFYMVHIPFQKTRKNKNGSDMQLVSDAMDLIRFYPHIDTYVLITGDSDFRPLLLSLRKAGKKIHVICDIKTAAQDLLILADNFIDYREVLPDSEDEESSEPEDDKQPQQRFSREYWFERLAETVSILKREGKTCNPGTVKIKMRMLNRGFDEKKLGYKQWSFFIAAAVKAGYVTLVENDDQTEILPGVDYKQETGSLQTAYRTLFEILEELDGPGKQYEYHPFSLLSTRLRDKGVNLKSLGFSKFKKFMASAEVRGLIETRTENLRNYAKRS